MSQEKKTVLIHIGAGKTGTTAIQNCLSTNADALRQNGVDVPDSDYFLKHPANIEPNAPRNRGNGICLFYFSAGYADRAWFGEADFLHRMEQILTGPHRFIVFSCEYLQYCYPERLAFLRDFCARHAAPAKVIYCVRDFASHAFSSWRQFVIHHGERSDWHDFQEKYTKDPILSGFETTLRKFDGIFDRKDIIVLNYSTVSHHLTRRFFDLFEQDYHLYKAATPDNVTDSNLVIDVMLEFNKLVADKFTASAAKRFYSAIRGLNEDQAGSRVLLTKSEYDRFTAAVQMQLEFVNGNFLPNDPIVVARPDQIGETGRPSDARLAARLARKAAAKLASEIPALRAVRSSPMDIVRRLAGG